MKEHGPSHEPRVIDLTTGSTTVVRIERDGDPFALLSAEARIRLIVRVLCGLVAYEDIDESAVSPAVSIEPISG